MQHGIPSTHAFYQALGGLTPGYGIVFDHSLTMPTYTQICPYKCR